MNIQFIMLILIAIIATTYIFYWYQKWGFPQKVKSKKKVLSHRAKKLNNQFEEENFKVRKGLSQIFSNLPIIGLSEDKRYEYEEIIDNIDWGSDSKIIPEDIHFQQLVNVFGVSIVIIILSFFFKPFIILMFSIPYFYLAPVNGLKSIINADVKDITYQLPDFFDAIYAQYSDKEANILFSDVVSSYIPVASPTMQKALKRLLIDLESGESRGIALFDNRYKGSYVIHRFCSLMQQRLKGEEASYVAMYHFRESLQKDVDVFMQDDLTKRESRAMDITQATIGILLTEVMIVYFALFLTM